MSNAYRFILIVAVLSAGLWTMSARGQEILTVAFSYEAYDAEICAREQ